VQDLLTAVVFGGIQITWLRALLATAGDALLVAYFVWVLRSLGK
jgi:hypothetical protein